MQQNNSPPSNIASTGLGPYIYVLENSDQELFEFGALLYEFIVSTIIETLDKNQHRPELYNYRLSILKVSINSFYKIMSDSLEVPHECLQDEYKLRLINFTNLLVWNLLNDSQQADRHPDLQFRKLAPKLKYLVQTLLHTRVVRYVDAVCSLCVFMAAYGMRASVGICLLNFAPSR